MSEHPSGTYRNRQWMEQYLPPPVTGDYPERLTGLSDDSRLAKKGHLFIVRTEGALVPEHLDLALEQGVALLLAPDRLQSDIFRRLGERGVSVPVCVVSRIREATGMVAASWWGHPSEQLSVVGVTGTNGKTTSSFLARSILTASGHPSGLIGTVWFDTGDGLEEAPQTTPGALFLQEAFFRSRNKGLSAVSMEVSSHALDQERVAGTTFRVVHFTNLTRDHLDYHKTFAAYFQAKSRLLFWTNPDGTIPIAVVNGDDPHGLTLIEGLKDAGRPVISYGHRESFDIHPSGTDITLAGIRGRVMTRSGGIVVDSVLPGDFNLSNIMGAVGCSLALGLLPEKIEEGIRALPGVPGRFERVPSPAPFAVIVDYAHTDDALQNILASLRPLTAGRVITVFGCGGDRDRGKRPRMGRVASALSDLVVMTSDNPRTESPEAILDEIEPGVRESGRPFLREPDRKKAIAMALEEARAGDAVLIAGKGHEPYQIIGKTKSVFDDRLVAREILEKRYGVSPLAGETP